MAPASLPALPDGLEPEGNGYQVRLSYAPSGTPLTHLDAPATLGLSAPAPPTALYELIDGTWHKADFTPVTADTGFTSVIALDGPGTFLQAYDPTSVPVPANSASPAATGITPPTPAASPRSAMAAADRGASDSAWLLATAGAGALLLASGLAALHQHRQQQNNPRHK